LNFTNLPLTIDDNNENIIDLGQDVELSQIITQQFPINIEITNLLLEKDAQKEKNHLWLTTFNSKDKDGQIIDINSDTTTITWDRSH